MLDSAPDISHTNQVAEVIRYVIISNRTIEIKVVFLRFFSLEGNTAAEILRYLEKDGLDIMKCRSQCYDNAATMAEVCGGVQTILKSKNAKALWLCGPLFEFMW